MASSHLSTFTTTIANIKHNRILLIMHNITSSLFSNIQNLTYQSAKVGPATALK